MVHITPEQVWNSIKSDTAFTNQPRGVQEVVKPFILALPVLLSDLLDKPLTFECYLTARIRFVRHQIEQDIVTQLLDTVPVLAASMSKGALTAVFQAVLEELLDEAEVNLASHVPSVDNQGLSEEERMLSPDVGLSDQLKAMYLSGELTVGKLLLLQPMVMYKNN